MEQSLGDKSPVSATAAKVGKDGAKKCAGCEGLGMRTTMRRRGPYIQRTNL
ncbi:hypothetical protein ES708_23723 [subsurface metagenome]